MVIVEQTGELFSDKSQQEQPKEDAVSALIQDLARLVLGEQEVEQELLTNMPPDVRNCDFCKGTLDNIFYPLIHPLLFVPLDQYVPHYFHLCSLACIKRLKESTPQALNADLVHTPQIISEITGLCRVF
jgi:hypothetical protein